MMIRSIAICLLIAFSSPSLRSIVERPGIQPAGLSGAPAGPAPIPESGAGDAPANPPCSNDVSFTRGIKYGSDDSELLDVAVAPATSSRKKPIVVFFASGFEDDHAPAGSPVSQAMCFAAVHGLVAVQAKYAAVIGRTARPEGAEDVAAAISWIFENADLFSGNAQEIVAIGFGASASHLIGLLLHETFRVSDDHIAGVVLVSGVFQSGKSSERRWVGAEMSRMEIPIILAWSSNDTLDLKSQNERLNQALCDAGHCPRTTVLDKPDDPGSVFDLDGASSDLHQRLRQLIGQLDARGLP
jgi:Carboxylesterase family